MDPASIAAIAAAIMPLLSSIFNLGSFETLPINIQNRLNNYAMKIAQEWMEKQQQSDYSGNSVVSSVPNRSQLESMLYKENADATHKFMRDLEVAKQKDLMNYNNNKVLYGIGKAVSNIVDIPNKSIHALIKGLTPKEYQHLIQKHPTMGDWLDGLATRNTRAQADKWKDVQAKNQDRVNKFSHYVAQSHDRFKRSTPQDAQNTQNTINNINEYRRERQV